MDWRGGYVMSAEGMSGARRLIGWGEREHRPCNPPLGWWRSRRLGGTAPRAQTVVRARARGRWVLRPSAWSTWRWRQGGGKLRSASVGKHEVRLYGSENSIMGKIKGENGWKARVGACVVVTVRKHKPFYGEDGKSELEWTNKF